MKKDELESILKDQKLAKLGDLYVNFLYSLALTQTKNEPTAVRVTDKDLAEAARKAGLREILPKRTSRGDVANAIESLLIHAWLNKIVDSEEIVNLLKKNAENPAEAFANVATEILRRLGKDEGWWKLQR